jgi:hypothetical protein
MLNVINQEALVNHDLLQLLKDYRRIQVSRYPVDVHCGPRLLEFKDSRVDLADIGTVWYDPHESNFVVSSPVIKNERYASYNSKYHQRVSKDLKKILKYMKDYIRLYTPYEIAKATERTAEENVDRWKQQAYSSVIGTVHVNREIVMQEVLRMHAVGYVPQTPAFAALMEKGIPAWEESQRRSNRKVMQIHVFINPDETVDIFCEDKMGYGGINQGVTSYPSMEATPQCVQQQVAMLRMTEDATFVPEVGTKITSRTYWVDIYPE